MKLRVVIDTNVIVSALLKPGNPPSHILRCATEGRIIPCFSGEIFREYKEVLFRPKFPFRTVDIYDLFEQLRETGFSVTPKSLYMKFTDESDRVFYETAKFCNAILITGNARHFPRDPAVMSPADFFAKFPAV